MWIFKVCYSLKNSLLCKLAVYTPQAPSLEKNAKQKNRINDLIRMEKGSLNAYGKVRLFYWFGLFFIYWLGRSDFTS